MNPPAKPWLDQRPGESRDEWLIRQQRSCFYCPHAPFRDGQEADAHELACPNNPDVRKQGT